MIHNLISAGGGNVTIDGVKVKNLDLVSSDKIGQLTTTPTGGTAQNYCYAIEYHGDLFILSSYMSQANGFYIGRFSKENKMWTRLEYSSNSTYMPEGIAILNDTIYFFVRYYYYYPSTYEQVYTYASGTLSSGFTTTLYQLYGFAEYNGAIYTTQNGKLYKLTNKQWKETSSLPTSSSGMALSLCAHDGFLYAELQNGSASTSYKWNGTTWTSLGDASTSTYNCQYLYELDGVLYRRTSTKVLKLVNDQWVEEMIPPLNPYYSNYPNFPIASFDGKLVLITFPQSGSGIVHTSLGKIYKEA